MIKALWIAAGLLVVLAFGLMIIPGFQFSIVLCFAFAALLVLVSFLLKFPSATNLLLLKLICLVLVLGILAAAVTAGFILSAAHPNPQPACQCIIVLGAGVRGTVPSLSLSERIQAAYGYLTANPNTVAILSGGQGPGEEITEAACMYRELTNMGIDPSRLLLEERSTSTIENLQFSLDVAEAANGNRPVEIGIVSSEYHLFRAGLFAKGLGLESFGIPAKTTWIALRVNYYLREIVAVWKYLVLGP